MNTEPALPSFSFSLSITEYHPHAIIMPMITCAEEKAFNNNNILFIIVMSLPSFPRAFKEKATKLIDIIIHTFIYAQSSLID